MMWISVEGKKEHESNMGIHFKLHWEQEKWFWTLTGGHLILPITGSVYGMELCSWGETMILEPFPTMAYTPVLMIPLENLLNSPVLEKYACFLYPLIDCSPSSKANLSVKPRWRKELMPIFSLLRVFCSRDRSALLPLFFCFWKAHLRWA